MNLDFRIDLLRQRIKIGEARCTDADIRFNRDAEICRALKTKMSSTDFRMSPGITFDKFTDRIRPVLFVGDKEYPLGVFMTIASPETMSDTGSMYELEAYDETMILKQAAFTSRTNYVAGTRYLYIVNQMLTECGFSEVVSVSNSAVLPAAIEIAPGTTYLEAINYFLDGINYQHVHADSRGRIILQPNTEKQTADHIYSDKNGMIIPPISQTTDIYNLPNVLIGVASSPDRSVLTYKKENTDPNSQISIPRRGYRVVKKYQINNIADQATLKDYIDQKYLETSQITETVNMSTALEGGHEFGDTVQLRTSLISGLFNEIEWRISLGASGTMTHKLERKIFV